MHRRDVLFALAVAGPLLLASAGPAAAARIRFHYAVAPGSLALCAPAAGERLTLRGWQAYECPPPRATHLVSFRHPATGQVITVPLALSLSTPKMEYGRDRIIYNYGSETVEVRFVGDGSVYVIYDSGLLRAPPP